MLQFGICRRVTYATGQDPLCYPGTIVLRNKANIRDQAELDAFELEMFLTRSIEPVTGHSFSQSRYLALHFHLFQDVYDWAGRIRTIRIGKSGTWFCFPEFIEVELGRLFSNLSESDCFSGLTKPEFARCTAKFLADLNAIHPFREGNGRCQMTFLGMLTENAGFHFLGEKLNPKHTLDAMVQSFH
jgi:cell filamentation protein